MFAQEYIYFFYHMNIKWHSILVLITFNVNFDFDSFVFYAQIVI